MLINKIKQTYLEKQYRINTAPYLLNIGGIRTVNSVSNKFDDLIFCFYTSEINRDVLWTASATTDPGLFYLKNPMNTNGCGLLVPNQYTDVYELGNHRGLYKAFLQTGTMSSYRDNNKNESYEINPTTLESSVGYGCNLHRASKNSVVDKVNNYSAMCQVLQKDEDLQYLLMLADKQIEWNKHEQFDYTLILSSDVQ